MLGGVPELEYLHNKPRYTCYNTTFIAVCRHHPATPLCPEFPLTSIGVLHVDRRQDDTLFLSVRIANLVYCMHSLSG